MSKNEMNELSGAELNNVSGGSVLSVAKVVCKKLGPIGWAYSGWCAADKVRDGMKKGKSAGQIAKDAIIAAVWF